MSEMNMITNVVNNELEDLTEKQRHDIALIVRAFLTAKQSFIRFDPSGFSLSSFPGQEMAVDTDDSLTEFVRVVLDWLNISFANVSARYDEQQNGTTELTINYQKNELSLKLDASNRSNPSLAKSFAVLPICNHAIPKEVKDLLSVERSELNEVCAVCCGFTGLLFDTAKFEMNQGGGCSFTKYSRIDPFRLAWTYWTVLLMAGKDPLQIKQPSDLNGFASRIFQRMLVSAMWDFSKEQIAREKSTKGCE